MMQCCVPTFRRDYLSPASWHIPQKIISAHLVPLLQILPQHNKQEAPFITRFFAGSQPLASKCEPRHVAVAVPNPFLHHRYFGPYYQRYWTQITITVLYCKVTKHTYPAVRKINFFGQSSSFSLHLIQRFVNLLIPAKYNISDWVWSQSCTAFFSFFFFFFTTSSLTNFRLRNVSSSGSYIQKLNCIKPGIYGWGWEDFRFHPSSYFLSVESCTTECRYVSSQHSAALLRKRRLRSVNSLSPFCYKLAEDRMQPSIPLSCFLMNTDIHPTTTRDSMACYTSWKKRNAYRFLAENLTG